MGLCVAFRVDLLFIMWSTEHIVTKVMFAHFAGHGVVFRALLMFVCLFCTFYVVKVLVRHIEIGS